MRSILKRVAPWAVLVGWIVLAAPAGRAQCLPVLCGLTVLLQSDASGVMLGGSGTGAASMSFSTMQAYGGSVPTGVTKIVGSTNWTVATPFDIKVTCRNLLNLLPCTIITSPTYTLTAQLQSSDSTNTWLIGGTTLSSGSSITLTSSGTYAVVYAYTLSLIIPFSEMPGTISNTINFVVTAN